MAPSRLIPTAPAVGARRPAVGEAVHLRLPCFEFGDASFASPADAVWAWRDAFSVLFDVAVSTPQALASFQGSIVGYHFGQMLVGIWQSSDQIQRRSNTTIARSGIDHIMLRCLRAGRCEGKADGLLEPPFGAPGLAPLVTGGVDDDGPLRGDFAIYGFRAQSASSSAGSYSCTGWAGMMVEMACL